MPKVAKKMLPMTVVAMQYCAEAGTEVLPAMAQIGNATEDTPERAKRVTRTPLRRVLRRTGWVMFAELGLTDA